MPRTPTTKQRSTTRVRLRATRWLPNIMAKVSTIGVVRIG